jgi:hypothetical protein
MSKEKSTGEKSVVIGREHWDVPVSIPLPAYLKFVRRMDSRLRRLVARWSHTASPWARGTQGLGSLPESGAAGSSPSENGSMAGRLFHGSPNPTPTRRRPP